MTAFLARHPLGCTAGVADYGTTPAGFNLDASTDKFAAVFVCPEDMTITDLGFQSSTGAGAQPDYIISLQGVDASGLPDGTIKGGGTPASLVFTGTATGGWQKKTIANTYAAVRGEVLALVVEYSSGTIGASNFMRVVVHSNARASRAGIPYPLTNSGSWSKQNDGFPSFAIYAGTAIFGAPSGTGSANSFSGTQEVGLKFTLDAALGDTFKVGGAMFSITSPATALTLYMALYDGTTLLQSKSIDSDHVSIAGNANRFYELYFDDATLATLSCGTAYRLILAVSGGSAIPIKTYSVSDNNDLDAFPGGKNFYETRRTQNAPPATGGNAWTDNDTVRPLIQPIIMDWVEPAGGGGGGGGPLIRGRLVA